MKILKESKEQNISIKIPRQRCLLAEKGTACEIAECETGSERGGGEESLHRQTGGSP